MHRAVPYVIIQHSSGRLYALHTHQCLRVRSTADERLHPGVWDYYSTGADDEVTLRENRVAFERIQLRPRVLVDVSHVDLRTRLLDMPIDIADLYGTVSDAGRGEVYLNGGIRRATDVLKALALGARAVFVGRPVL